MTKRAVRAGIRHKAGRVRGVSVSQLLRGEIPSPTHVLKCGDNIPKDVFDALDRGEVALLNDEQGNPYSYVLKDCFGTLREKLIGV